MADALPKSPYADPTQTCDIVLKGGITSGVVYPLALVSLAEKYRFSNIGGTSAGAIAAAAAAAAEYGRHTQTGGFARLAKVPNEIGPHLLSMFQPTPALKPLFDIFIAALKSKSGSGRIAAICWAAISGYYGSAALGLLPGVIVIGLAWWLGAGAGFVAFGLLLALTGLVVALILRLWRAANTDLAADDFGLCPGIRQTPTSADGFTDWLAQLIQESAGRDPADPPLTFGDLTAPPNNAPPIQLAMMTTSLMEERPYTLPLVKDRRFFFRKDEWQRIFPQKVMTVLTQERDRYQPPAGETGDYFYFPDETRLPLIVGARMSLSFPGLIAGVPLWRHDYTLVDKAEQAKLRRCLFSDGGLSSNFPIHFFDHLLPNTPTFAISLDSYVAEADRGDQVWLPESASSGIQTPLRPAFSGLGDFLMRLVYSAKDWQDNLQSTLPGYRERIVHVVLKPDEGGLNLAMSEATIQNLVGYGQLAGTKLRDEFDLDQHRWRRFLVAMSRMEETLDEVAVAYAAVASGPEPFGAFLDRYANDPASYTQDTLARVDEMRKRGKELADAGVRWRIDPTIRGGHIPRPRTHLRITPKY